MINKKGFTLIELLAVIAIIALISMIAIPNLVGLSDGVKRDNMLADAKKLISMAKYKVQTDFEIRNFTKSSMCESNACILDFDFLNMNGDIKNDPDDREYRKSESYVKYYKSSTADGGTVVNYCIVLIGEKRHIGSSTECVNENDLYSRSNVKPN